MQVLESSSVILDCYFSETVSEKKKDYYYNSELAPHGYTRKLCKK